MITVKIVDIISSASAVSPRTGLKVFDFVSSQINKGNSLTVSFDGVEDLTSAFCNAFIGKLYMISDPTILNSSLTFSDIDTESIWYKKITNAILLGTNENARTLHKENIESVIFS